MRNVNGRWICTFIALLIATFIPEHGVGQTAASSPFSLQVRGGVAIPTGQFADAEPGIGAEAGPQIGAAALWHFTPALAVSVGYSRSWFGCGRCAARGLDDQVADAGFDGALQLQLPVPLSRIEAWISAGGIFHELIFSGGGNALSSDQALGFRVGGGIALPLFRSFMITPGIHYSSYSAELELGAFPDQTVDVTHFTVSVGLMYRL